MNVRTRLLLTRTVFSAYTDFGSGSVGTGGADSVCCLFDAMPQLCYQASQIDRLAVLFGGGQDLVLIVRDVIAYMHPAR